MFWLFLVLSQAYTKELSNGRAWMDFYPAFNLPSLGYSAIYQSNDSLLTIYIKENKSKSLNSTTSGTVACALLDMSKPNRF